MGAGFLNGATVTFGGTFSTAVSVINTTTITAITPVGVAALPGETPIAVDIVVANLDGTSGTLYRAFTYLAASDPEGFLPITIPVACSELNGQNDLLTYSRLGPFVANPIASDLTAGNQEQLAAFSSSGPAYDGRIKPDVVAPGTWVLSGYSSMYQEGYDEPNANPQNYSYQWDGWGSPLNEHYKYMGGTSMSNPLVAGGAAVVRDFYKKAEQHDASAALVKATLINSAVDMLDETNDGHNHNHLPIPNGREGWGRVNLENATDGSHAFVEETTGLRTGESATYTFNADGAGPFKVSLVWSDHAATNSQLVLFPGGVIIELFPGPNLVNDLDLVVTPPGGGASDAYKGNNFSGGWTQIGGTADRLNNVENVYIQSPTAGIWTVTVSGYNTPFGPQPYALVVDGVAVAPTPAPTVSTVAPNSGSTAGGDSVTISGTNFVGGASVFFDGMPATGINVVTSGSITATTPAHAAGAVHVVVTNPDSQSDVLLNGYNYGDPSAETITITKANYNSRKAKLTVEATSSEGGSTTLTATYFPGGSPEDMFYNPKKNKWSITFEPVAGKPDQVKVCGSPSGDCLETTSIGGK